MKRMLFVVMTSVALMVGIAPAAFADEGLAAAQAGLLTTQATEYRDYVLGTEVRLGDPDWYTMFKFTLQERSHVFAKLECAHDMELSYYDNAENIVSAESGGMHSTNTTGTAYTVTHSCDLDPGVYYLRVYINGNRPDNSFALTMTAEPVVSFDRPSITSLACPSPNSLSVGVSPVTDAMSYEYQYGTSPDFSGAETVVHPATSYVATELAGDAYYYARVRPFTVYNDGLRVYGNWSRAQAVYVEPTPNEVTISTASKSLKYATLKKKNQSFLLVADDVAGADLKYTLSAVSSRAKKYVSINGSTGAITVKKGLAKGTYKMTVKVSAKATGLYGAASSSKQLTLRVTK